MVGPHLSFSLVWAGPQLHNCLRANHTEMGDCNVTLMLDSGGHARHARPEMVMLESGGHASHARPEMVMLESGGHLEKWRLSWIFKWLMFYPNKSHKGGVYAKFGKCFLFPSCG